MLATEENKPEKFGVLSITNDKVNSIDEKPDEAENPLVNTGIYVFSPRIFDAISESESPDLTDAVKELVADNDACFEIVQDYWMDIDEPRKLWKADQVKRVHDITDTSIDEDTEIHENVDILGEARVAEGAELKPGTVIEGNTYIGEDAVIGPNTTLNNCTVGQESQVRQSALEEVFTFEKTIVDPNVFVEQSILAEETDVLSNTSIRESFIGARSFIEINNSIRGVKFVPDARTDLAEISK
jgi:bifunctional UDP-N-acetylglucosamine pyrophosphorylase/glucosamine-1-phosphate N-acetyltransferase